MSEKVKASEKKTKSEEPVKSKPQEISKKENAEKQKVLQQALSTIEKQFGKGSIMKLGDARQKLEQIDGIPTGALTLDMAIGIGGIPRGRIVEIFGPESSGKTTLTLSIIAQVQRLGGTAAFIDVEYALDPVYAEKIGVKVEDLIISQPDNGEQALQIAEMLVKSSAVDIVVIDSVAALVPKAEIEGDIGDSFMGTQARLMSQALRKLTSIISKSKTSVVFINQIRDKIGVMFGNPETTPGGKALKFYASLRLDIRRIGAIKKGEANVGNRVRVKVVKNKVAPPFRTAEFDIMFDEGISRSSSIIDLAVESNVFEKAGTWLSYNGERIGQGRDNVRTYLRQNPIILEEIESKVRHAMMEKETAGSLVPAGSAAAD